MIAMRPLPNMIGELRSLSDHLRELDSASLEGALLNDAANYIEGSAHSLREHMAMVMNLRVQVEQTRTLMEDAAEELAENASGSYPHRDAYPDEMRRYMRDMELPNAIRSMLKRGIVE
jgi:hypothetical protein